MIKQTLAFENPVYLSLRHGQLCIDFPEEEEKKSVTRPIEDIGVVVLTNRRITITTAALDALLENNSAVITCNAKGMPAGMLLPLSGNSVQTERYGRQINASLPLKKQLWQQTMRMKIMNQAAVLEQVRGMPVENLRKWAREVRSGDPENLEARAAVFYWKNLFEARPDFVRNMDEFAPNSFLNYGYAILRAVIARALVSSGLLPSLGIHHHNRYDAFCLADDVMEPYRPYVDRLVVDMYKRYGAVEDINREQKQLLLTIPTLDVFMDGKRRPLMIAASQTTASLARCFMGSERLIDYPVVTNAL